MQPSTIGARRTRAGLAAAGVAALLALFTPPASAGQLSAQEIQSDAYRMARLHAGQSWDSPQFSITEMRPGTLDQGQFARYIREVSAEPTTDPSTKSEAGSRTAE
jgi:hypothetical protein